MNRFLIIAGIFVGALSIPAISCAAPTHTVVVTAGSSFYASSAWWRSLSHSQKLLAVNSMTAAEAFTFQVTKFVVVADVMRSGNNGAMGELNKKDVSFTKAAEWYVSKLDKYYASHPRSTNEVPNVLACFADTPFPKEGCTARKAGTP